jgi:hypothetical protein
VEATGITVMAMEPEVWAAFARTWVRGGPKTPEADGSSASAPATQSAGMVSEESSEQPSDVRPHETPAEPPKPGTAAYKALPHASDRAAARAYWSEQDKAARLPEPMTPPEQEPLPLASGQ